ncbi:MAG: hypothetical protein JXK08_09420, partial [Flavobacteriaceae bacterium]|nr:hypothetical protein [Flavobacteriaceae bacterium]
EKVTNLKDMLSASKSLDIAGGDPILTSLASDFSIGCVKVNVWIEGNDRDADYSLKGGLFEIGLKFIGIDKNYDIVAPSVSANLTTNTITGYASGMEYSKDYGNYWIPYEINSNPVFNSGDTVYVRKSETMTTFASTYTELNF